MNIGQEIDEALSRIKTAKDRKLTVIERSKSQKSNLIKFIWKAFSVLLETAGKPCGHLDEGLELTADGYTITCWDIKENRALSVKRLSDNETVYFHSYDKYNKRYYHYYSGDKLFCEEILKTYPQIIHEMAIAYVPMIESEADIVEAKEEVGLLRAL